MPTSMLMPSLSPTMEEGVLAKWLVKEGDYIKPGMMLCSVETDKTTVDYESMDEGYLRKIVVPGGSPAKVNQLIAILADDKNEDGTDKYPLGMFDEAYQDDRFNYMKEKFIAEQREALEREAQEAETRRAQEALTNSWNEKLDPARERYPDFNEKGENLLETFADLDPAYGEYLTAMIMSMDYGPDVLYFLSNNIDEAERIVKLGPQGATIALGRIEARFDRASDEDGERETKPRPKVSKASPPPPRNRGSNAALPEVTDDTDDLDAFSAKLFKKR